MILSGSADSEVEDAKGKTLGYDQDGQLHFEIAGGVPVCPMGDALFSEREFYVLPDGDYQVNIYGKGNGGYNWQTLNQDTMCAIDTETNTGSRDVITIAKIMPSESGVSLGLETSDSNKLCSVSISRMYRLAQVQMPLKGSLE